MPTISGVGEGVEAAWLTSANDAGGLTPATAAVTMYPPASRLAVKLGATAMPFASVVTTAVVPRPANHPDGPLAGAWKVMTVPGTGFFLLSLTITASGTANGA